jgi:hypothetical protein
VPEIRREREREREKRGKRERVRGVTPENGETYEGPGAPVPGFDALR